MGNPSDQQTTPPDRTWFAEGILFEEYNDVSLVRVQQMVEKGVLLLNHHKVKTAPVVITLKGNAQHNKMRVADFSKLANTPMTERTAAIFIVGVQGINRKLANIASRLFFENHMQFFNTFEEAKRAAKAFNQRRRSDESNVLDRQNVDL